MAYYIKKTSVINPDVTVYYAGSRRWSDDSNEKALYASEDAANGIITNPDGKNGGFRGATVVRE